MEKKRKRIHHSIGGAFHVASSTEPKPGKPAVLQPEKEKELVYRNKPHMLFK